MGQQIQLGFILFFIIALLSLFLRLDFVFNRENDDNNENRNQNQEVIQRKPLLCLAVGFSHFAVSLTNTAWLLLPPSYHLGYLQTRCRDHYLLSDSHLFTARVGSLAPF